MLFSDPFHFDIRTFWDGKPCEDRSLWGTIDLQGTPEGLRVTATLPHQLSPSIPEAPQGSRVANLWEYDVVECFLVGAEKYLEVELGAGGHFLVLDFTAPRVRDQEYESFAPVIDFESDSISPPCVGEMAESQRGSSQGRWRSSVTIPWNMIPKGLHAANAFVIARDHFLCASPLPGPQADFHQPARFPEIPYV